jgi:hypothetical protein
VQEPNVSSVPVEMVSLLILKISRAQKLPVKVIHALGNDIIVRHGRYSL